MLFTRCWFSVRAGLVAPPPVPAAALPPLVVHKAIRARAAEPATPAVIHRRLQATRPQRQATRPARPAAAANPAELAQQNSGLNACPEGTLCRQTQTWFQTP